MKKYNVDTPDEMVVSKVFTTFMNNQIIEAKKKELDSWKEKNVYKECANEGQELVSLKWVLKPKIIDGLSGMKARLVAKGFQEIDDFRRDSPMVSKSTLRIVLVLITTMRKRLYSLDIKTAFLNNDTLDRDIYVKPPKEAETKCIWKLCKTIYGLKDASRAWYLKLKGELLALGCISTPDPSVVMWRENNILCGLIALYVDDLLYSGSKLFFTNVVDKIQQLFTVGSYNKQAFTYIGIDLVQNEDMSITINQKSYIQGLEAINVDSTVKKDTPLPEPLITPLRSLIGKLNWAISVSRPDLAYEVCRVSTKMGNPTMNEIHSLNKVVNWAKANDVSIKFPNFSSFEDLYLIVFADSAFGNLGNGASQGGYIIFVSDGSNSAPICWSSHRIKRVARSTLTAETLIMVDAIDQAIYLSNIISALIYGRQQNIPIKCYTDSNSLFVASKTDNVVEEKRLLIELASIRESVEEGLIELNWVDTKRQLADCLTKSGASPYNLIKVIQNGSLSY